MAEESLAKHPALDLWLAVLAGDRVWIEREHSPSTRERIAAGLAVFAMTATLAVVYATIATRIGTFDLGRMTTTDRRLLVIPVVATLAAIVLTVHPLQVWRGRPSESASFWPSLLWRGATYLALIAAMAAALPRIHSIGAWPLGVLAGADAAISIWVLGLTLEPRRWAVRFVTSPLHFGVVGALAASALLGDDESGLRLLLGLYVAMWVGIAAMTVTFGALGRVSSDLDRAHAEDRREIAERERSYRAHWLHDDVLSEVRLASLRVAAGTATAERVQHELHELDHRLRMRQLDEAFVNDTAHIYEILQPHLRRAQALELELRGVPPLEVTETAVNETCGRMLSRAISVTLSNAVNAGATTVSVGLSLDRSAEVIEYRLTDDGGGFDLDAVPAGRGLATLIDDLGADSVERLPSDGGSTMVVRVPLQLATPRNGAGIPS